MKTYHQLSRTLMAQENCRKENNYEWYEKHTDTINGIMENGRLVKRLINHTEGDFFWKIQNGKGKMPSFKEDLLEKQIWNIVNFIKGLSKN